VTGKLDVSALLDFRPLAEEVLGIRYKTKPLRTKERAALYLGSFDPFDDSQTSVVDASLNQTGADHVYVGVLECSRKPLFLPQTERILRARQQLARFGDKARVIAAPALDDAAGFVRDMKAEFQRGLVVVFGANVFDANRVRLAGVSNLDWAIAPVPNFPFPSDLADGVVRLRLGTAGCPPPEWVQ